MTAMRRGTCSLCRTTTTKETSEHLDGGRNEGLELRISYMLGQMSPVLSVKGKPVI